MTCAHCGSPQTRVKETRKSKAEVIRARICLKCGQKFTTSERITADYIQVRYRDGTTQPFARERLRKSIARADPEGLLSSGEIDEHVNRVVELLQPDAPNVPVRSSRIGDLVLQQLHQSELADIVGMRYALALLGPSSEHKLFRRLRDLATWLQEERGNPTVSKPDRIPAIVIKRGDTREKFEPDKLARSIVRAAEGCGTEADLRSLGSRVAFVVQDELKNQVLVTTGQIAAEALKELLQHNELAYLRYASAVKRYRSLNDFWLDIHPLVED
ncbi:ATP cone domain-containing protein [Glycomyces tritici]|uniref:ATP cone domain-containing protein n=1 Tax=Glycomyces tritici TaxID=2665176 RepID=A0ABT7YQL4_9ACTN|nr:ATP cone domain-containing protein [Glycomyces tritici]MDN3240885.1 ATP cone domain-containing protein [Glycomyces tritici]MDN3242912.1 ATP cone domain-containing protein [Glycomyces tritici]